MQEQINGGAATEHLGSIAGATASAAGGRRLTAFSIIERKGLDKPIWQKVGTAFFNRDGSINLYLDAVPLQGKIQLRTEQERDRERPEGGRRSRADALHDEE